MVNLTRYNNKLMINLLEYNYDYGRAKIAAAAVTTDPITIPAIPPDDRPKKLCELSVCYRCSYTTPYIEN